MRPAGNTWQNSFHLQLVAPNNTWLDFAYEPVDLYSLVQKD